MKAVVQTVLIGGGIIGLLVVVPISFFVWKMRGALSADEHGYLVMACCLFRMRPPESLPVRHSFLRLRPDLPIAWNSSSSSPPT
jgi:hypothetical protein